MALTIYAIQSVLNEVLSLNAQESPPPEPPEDLFNDPQ